ncbi:type II toxin-antitoxin system RelE/ParE family toxin [Silvanigrella sp.]|jgi:putative addiction module killer protein|uniref:type II toxin-antitoxin system RelE/ParE family toxin n=1 Tax=Silvanigrella sp. TaxID=2024976 RepID=UPI0037CB5D15
MSNFRVLFWANSNGEKPVAKWMKALKKEDQIYLADIFRDLANDGPLSRPKVFKHLEGDLWEIKDKRSPGPGFRIYFGFNGSDIICLVVHAGSKKSQDRDIELAKKRLKSEV